MIINDVVLPYMDLKTRPPRAALASIYSMELHMTEPDLHDLQTKPGQAQK